MSELRTERAESWAELIDRLYQGSWDESIERFRSPFVFRGMPRLDCDLSTSLLRLGAGYEDIGKLERHLLRNFRKYAHSSAGLGQSVWNWLALAAHYGLQTRLLDWTYSPLVAMHFATENVDDFGEDAVIWCVNHRETNRLLPEPLRRVAEDEGFDVFTAEMLDEVAGSLEKLQQLSGDDFVLFMEPPSLDERIVNQFALFSFMSNPASKLDEWLENRRGLARRVIVPAELKWEVRDKLDQAGITERMLYPGLDGLTRWLSRYYVQRRGLEGRR